MTTKLLKYLEGSLFEKIGLLSFRTSHAALVWSWIRNKILTDTIFWKASYRSLSRRETAFVCVFSFFIASHKRFYATPIYGRVYIGKLLIHTRVRQSVVGCAAGIISGTGRTPARLLVVLDLWAAQMAVRKFRQRKSKSAAVLLFIGGREPACWTDGRTDRRLRWCDPN